MKCKLPNQETGSSCILLGPMADEYDPPGKAVREDDDGTKYVEVTEDVGTALIADHGFEELDASSSEDSDSKEETNE